MATFPICSAHSVPILSRTINTLPNLGVLLYLQTAREPSVWVSISTMLSQTPIPSYPRTCLAWL